MCCDTCRVDGLGTSDALSLAPAGANERASRKRTPSSVFSSLLHRVPDAMPHSSVGSPAGAPSFTNYWKRGMSRGPQEAQPPLRCRMRSPARTRKLKYVFRAVRSLLPATNATPRRSPLHCACARELRPPASCRTRVAAGAGGARESRPEVRLRRSEA